MNKIICTTIIDDISKKDGNNFSSGEIHSKLYSILEHSVNVITNQTTTVVCTTVILYLSNEQQDCSL